MPGFDGTGPRGQGALTGGRRGWCAEDAPDRTSWRGAGRGFGYGRGWERSYGRGRGGGYGWRNQYYATGLTGWQRAEAAEAGAPQTDQRTDVLARLETRLDEVLARLERLEASGREQ